MSSDRTGCGARMFERISISRMSSGMRSKAQHQPERPVQTVCEQTAAGQERTAGDEAVEVDAGAKLAVLQHRLTGCRAAARVAEGPDRRVASRLGTRRLSASRTTSMSRSRAWNAAAES